MSRRPCSSVRLMMTLKHNGDVKRLTVVDESKPLIVVDGLQLGRPAETLAQRRFTPDGMSGPTAVCSTPPTEMLGSRRTSGSHLGQSSDEDPSTAALESMKHTPINYSDDTTNSLNTMARTTAASDANEVGPPSATSSVDEVAYYPPTIYFPHHPPDLSVQSLLSLIRVPGGRIRHVQVGNKARKTSVTFAETSAHNTFLENVYHGLFRAPWLTPSTLRVGRAKKRESIGEDGMAWATRVLIIQGLDDDHMKIDAILEDLSLTSGGWHYGIEKTMRACAANLAVLHFTQISFTSIADAVHAKETLETHELVATKYREGRLWYGHDECSTTGQPLPLLRIIDLRGGGRGEDVNITIVPPALAAPSQVLPARPKAGRSTAASPPVVRIGRGLCPVTPFACHHHGIFVRQVPDRITYPDLFGAIAGGRVRRAHIFRPTAQMPNKMVFAAVFFTDEVAAANILARITSRHGLYIPAFEKRYNTTAYVAPPGTNSDREQIPRDSTRIVSITFDDLDANQGISAARIQTTVRSACQVVLDVQDIKMVVKSSGSATDTTHRLRKCVIELTSIHEAMVIKDALAQVHVTGSTRIIRYERDPCARSIGHMR